VARDGRLDFEAVEGAVRRAVLRVGAELLEALLRDVGTGRRPQPVRCRCGAAMESRGLRTKFVQTLVGWVRFSRSLYACPRCGRTRYPGDEDLDVAHTSHSPGLRRQTARLGAKEPFREVARDLAELAGLEVCRKEAERIAEGVGARMETWLSRERAAARTALPPPPETPKTLDTLYIELDGTGVPMVRPEVEGRKGKQADGTAKTREAKVGCVFTQTHWDEAGKPVRDPGSTSFVAAIESHGPFGWRLYAEAVRRGLFDARRVVVLGDGADWIRTVVQLHFGFAPFILDFYHACEHVGDLCRVLWDRDPKRAQTQREAWKERLWAGEVETLIQEAQALLPRDPAAKPEARTHLAYFDKNKDHMRYADYRAQGLFVGSGVVESACRALVGQRLKQPGMEWTVRGANDILALRAVILSGRDEEFWEQRVA
jgi:hypothetical protein